MRMYLVAMGAALLSAAAPAQSQSTAACDRACLESFADQYMDALIAHDPKRLPLARNLKMTENGQRLEPGDGFWRTATTKGTYRLFAADPESGQVGFIGTMREAAIPVIVALRLKVENRQIAEIELFVERNQDAAQKLDARAPDPVFLEPAHASREELVKAANLSFDAAKSESVTRIRERRFAVADQERGLVLAFVMFDHANGPTRPWSAETAEILKIENSKVRQVETVQEQVPYGMSSGWAVPVKTRK